MFSFHSTIWNEIFYDVFKSKDRTEYIIYELDLLNKNSQTEAVITFKYRQY